MTTTSTEAEEKTAGLAIRRTFSDPGIHPFDQVRWSNRTAEIKDESGGVVFRQKDCEFPEEYSQLAVDIVASKYFYGDPAVEGERERSMRQVVARVADTIAAWGWADGYFRSIDDHAVFHDELTWLLINQHGAFNSPVWFNVGLWEAYRTKGSYDGFRYDREADSVFPVNAGEAYKNPQGSACFIVGVGDSIPEIYERAAVEGRIFKYGSGSGSNNSAIRSVRETVRGGGTPSGPLSFMRVYDAVAKVTKSGGKTRRAAKMEILDDWHPDVMEFIQCKELEERKARVLIAGGYEPNFNGEAYSTVCFQNSNMSVRLSDAFMRKATGVDTDPSWQTIAVTTGSGVNARGDAMPRYDVGEIFDRIAEGTWKCGDPGVHFTDAIQLWHTCKATGPINACNPCSEYLFLDDSACNLASLNLMKFVDASGLIDVRRFTAAVEIFIIAQEILVDRCGYPTEKICRNSHDYRPLGLGYCNLGALLMHCGVPYDSDEGRGFAAAITSLMHAKANLVSAGLAGVMGPFPGYDANASSMLEVMDRHRAAASAVDEKTNAIRIIKRASVELWDRVGREGLDSGFRNAQVTLLAPTGTIGFLMDAATTGVEPDIALVKYKTLAGGGKLRYVNTVMQSALANLGYDQASSARIVRYVDEHDGIEGCPDLDAEHLPVFDCAFPTTQGGRAIAWKAHVDMMAAVQPFLSGAISKTVNMPESSSVAEIREAYIRAWNLGLKCIAIYRDNSKSSQPLSTKTAAGPTAEPTPRRKRLPATRRSATHKFEIQRHEGYVVAGFYDDGSIGEIFVTISKAGSSISGLMDAWATAISIGLQYGVPLAVLVEKFAHSRFEPAGFTKNPDIPIAKSITDYIVRWLGMEFVEGYRDENAPRLAGSESVVLAPAVESSQRRPAVFQADAPLCDVCGSITVRNGNCYRCFTCGSSLGCS